MGTDDLRAALERHNDECEDGTEHCGAECASLIAAHLASVTPAPDRADREVRVITRDRKHDHDPDKCHDCYALTRRITPDRADPEPDRIWHVDGLSVYFEDADESHAVADAASSGDADRFADEHNTAIRELMTRRADPERRAEGLDEPTLTRILGELAPVVGGDLLTGGVPHRIALASAIIAALTPRE